MDEPVHANRLQMEMMLVDRTDGLNTTGSFVHGSLFGDRLPAEMDLACRIHRTRVSLVVTLHF